MITSIVDCASKTPALKKPNCGFKPHRVSKIIGWKNGVSFDPAVDNFDDAKFSELVQCGKMWTIEVPLTTDNTPDATYETIEGLDKKTSSGVVDMDFALRCLTQCEKNELENLDSSWSLAFEVEDIEQEVKIMVSVNTDGTIEGFDTNVLGVKSNKLGTASTSSTLILRTQFSRKGTRQYTKTADLFDLSDGVDLCDYNIQNIEVQEVNPATIAANIVTVEHRYVEDCDGVTPVEGVGVAPVAVALVASNGAGQVVGDSTPSPTDPSIVVTTFDLNGSTIIGANPFTTKLWDTTLNKPVVKINDCFYKAESGEFSV